LFANQEGNTYLYGLLMDRLLYCKAGFSFITAY
jgi:hypothetical protein